MASETSDIYSRLYGFGIRQFMYSCAVRHKFAFASLTSLTRGLHSPRIKRPIKIREGVKTNEIEKNVGGRAFGSDLGARLCQRSRDGTESDRRNQGRKGH